MATHVERRSEDRQQVSSLAIGGMGVNLIIQASRGRRDARITTGAHAG